jgi:hypothetical protein
MGKNADDVINDELANDPLNPFIRMSHRYSHSALELFFYNKEIYELFMLIPKVIISISMLSSDINLYSRRSYLN